MESSAAFAESQPKVERPWLSALRRLTGAAQPAERVWSIRPASFSPAMRKALGEPAVLPEHAPVGRLAWW
jgi:hypothetical protein